MISPCLGNWVKLFIASQPSIFNKKPKIFNSELWKLCTTTHIDTMTQHILLRNVGSVLRNFRDLVSFAVSAGWDWVSFEKTMWLHLCCYYRYRLVFHCLNILPVNTHWIEEAYVTGLIFTKSGLSEFWKNALQLLSDLTTLNLIITHRPFFPRVGGTSWFSFAVLNRRSSVRHFWIKLLSV